MVEINDIKKRLEIMVSLTDDPFYKGILRVVSDLVAIIEDKEMGFRG